MYTLKFQPKSYPYSHFCKYILNRIMLSLGKENLRNYYFTHDDIFKFFQDFGEYNINQCFILFIMKFEDMK